MSRLRRNNGKSTGAETLAARILAVRDECHRAVEILSSAGSSTEAKLAECIRLGDSLDVTNRFLKAVVVQVTDKKTDRMKRD